MSGSNVGTLAFRSLHDGSCLGIGKDDTTEVVLGKPFSIRKANSSWVEWLQCSCSLMCSCSDKHWVLSHGQWLSSTVYTVTKNVQSMMALLTQNYSVITFVLLQ